MKRYCSIKRLSVLRGEVIAILGNKLCLPKILFELFPKRGLSKKEARQGDLLIDRAILLVSKAFEKLIQELESEGDGKLKRN